jgi:hypothetical protein
MTRKSASVTLAMLGTVGVFLGCNSNPRPTGTNSSGYRYRSHSVIFIPLGGFSSGGGPVTGGRAMGATPGRSGFGRSGSVGS